MTERLHFHFSLSCVGKGNGNPLQCSCLENPRDRGAWWAAISGVAQSRTQLTWLSSSSSSWWLRTCLSMQETLRDAGWVPGSGRSPGGAHGNPLQYSCLGNPMSGESWRATVHRVEKSQTRLKRLSTHAPRRKSWLGRLRGGQGLELCCKHRAGRGERI